MAAPRVCPRCETAHYNFQPCKWRENQKQNVAFDTVKPNLPSGWRPWNRDYLQEYERRGTMIVQRGLSMKPHGGRVIEPEKEE